MALQIIIEKLSALALLASRTHSHITADLQSFGTLLD